MPVGNLEFITSETITSSISTLDIDNVFSDKYDVYCITTQGISTISTTPTNINGRFLDSTGTVISATEYDYAMLVMRTDITFSEARATSADSIINLYGATDLAPETSGTVTYIFNPYDSSSYTFALSQVGAMNSAILRGRKLIGVHKSAETIRGIRLVFLNENVDSGTVSVYGVK
jgi:hypothetical protein